MYAVLIINNHKTVPYVTDSHLQRIQDLKEEIEQLVQCREYAMVSGADYGEVSVFDGEILAAENDLQELRNLAN